MILDIKLIKNPSMFCDESIAATVANGLSRNYEMMFCGMLEFSFEDSNNYINMNIGKKILCGNKEKDFLFFLKEYHGILITSKYIDEDIMNIIIKQINSGMPVLVFPMAQYCSWIETDEEKALFFLVVGYDERNVYGYDVHENSVEMHSLLINEIKKSYLNINNKKEVRVFEIVSDEKENISFEEIKSILIQSGYLNKTTFEQMKKLANSIEENFDITKEIMYDNAEVLDIPFFYKIMQILRARKLFAETCEYIAKKNEDSLALYIGLEYAKIGSEWDVIWRLFLKVFYFNQGDDTYYKKIADRIRRAAELEEKIVKSMLEGKVVSKKITKISNTIRKDIDYLYTDISLIHLFNNKAFEDKSNVEIVADLTGHNEYFIADNSFNSKKIVVGNTVFDIQDGYDNFICDGQKVKIIPKKYKRIYILGCAEWGEGSGNVELGCANKVETLLMEFPDWFYCKIDTTYVAWRGKAKDSEGNIVERAIFCLDYNLDQNELIYWIRFPQCDNMHIFGVKMLE